MSHVLGEFAFRELCVRVVVVVVLVVYLQLRAPYWSFGGNKTKFAMHDFHQTTDITVTQKESLVMIDAD